MLNHLFIHLTISTGVKAMTMLNKTNTAIFSELDNKQRRICKDGSMD